MKFIKLSFWIAVLVLLGGCSANPEQPVLHGPQVSQTEAFLPEAIQSLPTGEISPTSSLHASQVSPTEPYLPEATQLLPTADVSPTALENKINIQTHCPKEKLEIGELPDLPGTLVFSADNQLSRNDILLPEPGKNSKISFWHPQSDRILTFDLEEADEIYYYAESPNKEKLAFTQGKTTTISLDLMVLDHQGEELGRMVVPDDWTFFHWQNNHELLLQQFREKEKFNLVAIHLADQEQQILSTNFPDLYIDELFWSWGSQVLFNPEATQVLYPVRQYNPSQVYTVLWNVKENKEVARIAGSGWARWSPDGSRFLVTTDVEDKEIQRQYDILLINSTGEQSRATFFAEYYEQVWIDQPVWSPDNRYIAFWLVTTGHPIENAQFGVLDTETLTVDLFCKEISLRPARFEDYRLGFAQARVNTAIPVWSPDSNYLLIEDSINFESSAYLYDRRNYTITKIADKARPVGWLK